MISIEPQASFCAFLCGGCAEFRKKDRGFEVLGVTRQYRSVFFSKAARVRKQFMEPAWRIFLVRRDRKVRGQTVIRIDPMMIGVARGQDPCFRAFLEVVYGL